MFFSLVRPWVSMEDRLTTRYPIVTRALMKLHAILQGYAFWLFLTSQHLMFAPWSLVLLLKEVLLVLKCRCLDCLWALPSMQTKSIPIRFSIDAAGFSINSVTPDKLRCPTYWMLAPTGCVCGCVFPHRCIGSCHHRYCKINQPNVTKVTKIWTFGGCRSNPGDIVLLSRAAVCRANVSQINWC